MPKFGSLGELSKFLGDIVSQYEDYAQPLWDAGVTASEELANAPLEALDKIVKNMFHSANIVAAAKAIHQSEESAPDL